MIARSENESPPRREPRRRHLSCLPCRQHKLKCDRRVPCQSCVRHQRTLQCGQNPAPDARPSAPGATPRARLALEPAHYRRDWPPTSEDGYGGATREPSLPPLDDSAGSAGSAGGARAKRPAASTLLSPISQTATGSAQIAADLRPRRPLEAGSQGSVDRVSETMPVLLSPPLKSLLDALIGQPRAEILDTETFWRAQLIKLMPSRNQSDMLLAFYMENLSCLYSVTHEPSFRRQYYEFWELPQEKVDMIWLSLLFTMFSLSATFMTVELAEAVGLDGTSLRNLSHIWYSAGRQALYSGGFESRPRPLQLVVFLISQMYWTANNDGETLNSCLGQAVRNAQALRMDRDVPGSNELETQMRRRIWWGLWVCDTFQSLCYGRTPLIQTRADRVPLMANCSDDALTETSVTTSPMHEPAEISSKIVQTEVFKILRRLFVDDKEHISSWEYVRTLDQQIETYCENLPWYLRQSEWDSGNMPGHLFTMLVWQHYIVHSSIRIQRIRLLRPFLASQPAAYATSLQIALEMLDSYKLIRKHPALRRNPKFQITAYQSYSSAVQIAAFLLVERSAPQGLRQDIEMVIIDLDSNTLSLPVSTKGSKVLKNMLQLYDHLGANTTTPEAIAPEIAPVFGGESTARKYLRRCNVDYLLNRGRTSVMGRNISTGLIELFDFDMSLDMLNVDGWNTLLHDMDMTSY